MDKNIAKEIDEGLDVISNTLAAGIYFVAGMKIANSNMKPVWKVLCIDLEIVTMKRCIAQSRKIMEKSMSDDSVEYIKKVK
jgi:hypothetical protein